MAFEFTQVVAKLVKTVGFFRKVEALENDLMNLLGGPAAEVIASMQKNLQEPDGAGLMDFDTRITDRACDDRQCRRSIQNQPVGVELKPATIFL